MRLHRRKNSLTGLANRVESGDPTAYAEVGPSVYDQVQDSVWGQVRAVYDPNADPADAGVYADPRLPGGIRLEE